MCGIVGAVAQRDIVPILLEGLKRLEYRGYDSCGVAVHQQGTLAEGLQHGGVVQRGGAAIGQKVGGEQEVPVADHDEDGAVPGGAAQHAQAPGLVRLGPHVVANPGLEQVTQDEEGVGGCLRQVPCEGRGGAGQAFVQVDVGDEINAPPRGRCGEGGGARESGLPGKPGVPARRHAHQTSTAWVMTTSSSGTSSWKPLRPVLTFSMASTTSVPATTLPNTA